MPDLRPAALAALCSVPASLLLAPAATAQVDLPQAPRERPPALGPAERQAPSTETTTTIVDELLRPRGTLTNRVYNAGTPEVLGFDPETRRTPGRGQDGGLDLPRRPRRPLRPPAARPGADAPAGATPPVGAPVPGDPQPGTDDAQPPAGGGPAGQGAPAALDGLRPAVRLVYETVAAARKVEDRVVEDGARTLAESGEDGLVAARLALRQDHAPLFLCGVRALLRGGTAQDHDAVVTALRSRMPARAAAASVNALVQLDPVRSSPELLAELLRHPQAPARDAAGRALAERASATLVPLLVPALEDESADVRGRAVDLLTGIDAPAALELVLERLDDKSPTVARKAIDGLARARDPRTDDLLLAVGFDDPLPVRRHALAWVALAEREDLALRALIGPRQVPELLRALDSSQTIVSGAAAIALAGVGFRSSDLAATQWLDREVPSRLVKLAAGFEFFPDFEALRAPALRRLQQIGGVNHASDGSAWTRWWLESEQGFRATRAVLVIDPAAEGRVLARVRPGDGSGAFTLLGPELAAAAPETLGIEGEEVWLDAAQVHLLVAHAREEGLFGFERLPGNRGTQGLGGRSLEFALGDASKVFRFGEGLGTPWFDRVVDLARTLRRENRWQRFPDPGEHVDRRGLYLAERDWWQAERSQGERAARAEALLFKHLRATRPELREEGLAELARLADEAGTASEDDVPALLALLDEEPFYSARAKRLVGLVRRASGIDGRSRPEGQAEASLSGFAEATAADLERLLHDRFGPYAAEDLAQLLVDRGPEAVHAAARGERGLLRGVAATVMGRNAGPAEVALLRGLLEDPDPDVQVAALMALGRARAADARDDVILKAGYGEGPVRHAALRALGQIGGENALDVLVRALTSQDQRLKVPAVEGIAALHDVEAAPYLMSLLRAGRRSETFDAARAGVLALGSAVWDELFVALRAPSQELRREASLLLAEQLVAESVPALIRALSEDPDDARVADELKVLTCVDRSEAEDPAEEWYKWWDTVDRRSPLTWLLAACEARDLRPPAAETFANGGAREAREFLLALMAGADSDWLAERARRELGRLVGGDLGRMPADRAGRQVWLETLAERLLGGE